MRVFGSDCYAYTQKKQKLDPRCKKGIFVRYDMGNPGYLVYFPEIGKVLKYRVVKFTTKSVSKQQIQTEPLLCDDKYFILPRDNTDPDAGGASDADRCKEGHGEQTGEPKSENQTETIATS